MKEVRVLNSEKWQVHHWKSITAAYNKSPWLDHFRQDFEQLYETRFEFLLDWNMACHQLVCAKLAIEVSSSLSNSYIENYDEGAYLDHRKYLAPQNTNRLHPNSKRYPQVFEERHGFIPNLSVLDYLFCVGSRLVDG